MAETMPWYG